MELGPAWSGGDGDGAGRARRGMGSSTTIAKFRSTDSGRGWSARGLYPLARGCRRLWRGEVTAARCLLDLLGPAQRVLAADGEVAGGADSFLVIFRFGATPELGRSQRGTGLTLPTPLIESRVD
jgi:hypothetical protein